MSNKSEELLPGLPSTDCAIAPAVSREDIVEMPDVRWCRFCNQLCVPEGKGRCPICKRFTPYNTQQQKDRLNESRRKDVLQRLISKHGQPQGPVEESQFGALADVIVRLERARPGSTEHNRLVSAQQTLVSALHDRIKARQPSNEGEAVRVIRRVIIAAKQVDLDQ